MIERTMKEIHCSACRSVGFLEPGTLLPDGWWAGRAGYGDTKCISCAAEEEWIGVDWDGTTVTYEGWLGLGVYGTPIPLMVARIKGWLAEGKMIKIVTARAAELVEIEAIGDMCVTLFGVRLPVTNQKDYRMRELWDDRAVRVEKNTGRRI